jgi:hypothetical protein
MRKPELIILTIGLALPFIGNILGAMLYGEFPFYFEETMQGLLVLEGFHLIPAVLCIMYSLWATAIGLKRFRYAPVVITYLFIIFCHYEVMVVVATPSTHLTGDVLAAGLMMLGAPFVSILVFFATFIFTLLINLSVFRSARKRRDSPEHDGENNTG